MDDAFAALAAATHDDPAVHSEDSPPDPPDTDFSPDSYPPAASPSKRLRGRNIATHPRRVRTALNRALAAQLRADGRSWNEIGQTLNVHPKSAAAMVRAYMRSLPAPDVSHEREMVGMQLDDLYAKLLTHQIDFQTAGSLIRVLSTKMALLGLKPAAAVNVKHEGEIDHQVVHQLAPPTAEEALAAAEQIKLLLGEVASKHAESAIAVARREERERVIAEHSALEEARVFEGEVLEDGNGNRGADA